MSVATATVSRLGVRRKCVTNSSPGVKDSESFSRLYEQTVGSVYRYALVLVKNPERAEDVTADVYLSAWRNRESLREPELALSWLLSIAHNAAMSVLRASHEVADVDLLADRKDAGTSADELLLAEADASKLQAAMRLLTPEQQQVVFLRFFEELPHEAVAARLNRNPNAVRAIQFRALSRLRKLLEDSIERSA